ncbi:hypothetical protein M1247_00160 [Mycobacterium sp. 21AC1]|uniref:hypothetical protein n=1 Tax=[Mycobacterium] appelbergii TaxID=2939269 RepID=UPI0029393762|nr:hypothetical protein [Mycobacterium sp. 21AC1]MDV3123314.1 hypothetical protein [Mycobacterium sp. 21AC1]
MTATGAWPETDESVFESRKEMLSGIRSGVTEARLAWDKVKALVFNGLYIWMGGSATAAAAKVEEHSKAMAEREKQLDDAIRWCQNAIDHIGAAKDTIVGNVGEALKSISAALEEAAEKDLDATEAVQGIVDQTYTANKNAIQSLASRLTGKDIPETPPPVDGPNETGSDQPGAQSDGEELPSENSPLFLTGKTPQEGRKPPGPGFVPAVSAESEVEPVLDKQPAEQEGVGSGFRPAVTPESTPQPVLEHQQTEQAGAGSPMKPAAAPPFGSQQSPSGPKSPGVAGGSGAPGAPSLGGGAPSASAPSAPSSPLSASSPAASATPTGLDPSQAAAAANAQPFGPQSPAQQFAQGLSQGLNNAPPPTMQPAGTSVAPPVTDAPAPPPSATAGASGGGTGHAPVAPPTSTGAGGSSMGGGMGGMPLGPPPTAPPAGPSAPAPPPSAAPIANTSTPATAAAAAIPVSTARAERDAALAAARAGALRRKAGDHDPLSLARRLAAALNAPGMVNDADYKFFWITGLTVDGKIVVANNYGLAYIPEQVHLPEQVHMASADESISPAERASWVNEPVVAVQRWAEHHDTELRAVIATAEQFKNSDAGVHQEVLTPEDIPASGKMAGRDRLQVIAPQASSQLAQISDTDLVNVLPPALADVNPPEDRRTALWDKVWQPLASRSSKRGARHLRAFVEYAAHTQEQAIYAAHTAADPEDQRRAVNEFVYWQHVGQLTADAIAT